MTAISRLSSGIKSKTRRLLRCNKKQSASANADLSLWLDRLDRLSSRLNGLGLGSANVVRDAMANISGDAKSMFRALDVINMGYDAVTTSLQHYHAVPINRDRLWNDVISVYGNSAKCAASIRGIRNELQTLTEEVANPLEGELGNLPERWKAKMKRLSNILQLLSNILSLVSPVVAFTSVGGVAALMIDGVGKLAGIARGYCMARAEDVPKCAKRRYIAEVDQLQEKIRNNTKSITDALTMFEEDVGRIEGEVRLGMQQQRVNDISATAPATVVLDEDDIAQPEADTRSELLRVVEDYIASFLPEAQAQDV